MIAALLLAAALGADGFQPADPALQLGTARDVPACTRPAPSAWRWTVGDSVREAVVLGLLAADWHQTIGIGRVGQEINPILGRSPSPKRVTSYFALAAVTQLGVTLALPAPYRGQFQVGVAGVEAAVVWSNVRNGY